MNTTNIKLDAGMTAFIEAVNYKLLRQTRTCRLLTVGLVACGVCGAMLIKRIETLENKVSDIATVADIAWENPTHPF